MAGLAVTRSWVGFRDCAASTRRQGPAHGLHKACTRPPAARLSRSTLTTRRSMESQRADFRGARGAKTEFTERLGLARARHCSFTRVGTVQGFQYGGVVGCRTDGQTWSGLRPVAGSLDAGLYPEYEYRTSTLPQLLFASRPIPCWVRVSAEILWESVSSIRRWWPCP